MSSVAEKLDPSKTREISPLTPEEKKRRQRKGLVKDVIILAIIILGFWGFYEGMKFASGAQNPVVVVVSGSMEPTIHEGDLLFVHYVAPENIKTGTIEDKTGDVILYDSNGLWDNPQSDPIVHRVVGKRFDVATNMWYFKTKGDHNLDVDPPDCLSLECPNGSTDEIIEVPEDHILGVVWGDIPYIGSVVIWLGNPIISIPLKIIFGGALVLLVVWDIVHPEDEKQKNSKKGRIRDASLESPKDIVPISPNLGYIEVYDNNKGENLGFVGKDNDVVITSPKKIQVTVEKAGISLESVSKDENMQFFVELQPIAPLSPTLVPTHASTGLKALEPAAMLPLPLEADPTNFVEDPDAMLSIVDAGKRWVCPHCGNNDRRMIREEIDKTVLLNPYPPFYGKKLICGKCGMEWRHK